MKTCVEMERGSEDICKGIEGGRNVSGPRRVLDRTTTTHMGMAGVRNHILHVCLIRFP